jgi:ASCH domain
MKAITIKPAWAWAIVHGRRPVEIRTWRTLYRGPLLIHASASIASADADAAVIERQSGDLVTARIRSEALVVPTDLECGAVVGQVTLTDCCWIPFLLEMWEDMTARHGLPEMKLRMRCVRPWLISPATDKPYNAYAWMLTDHRAVAPVDCKGKLGFWNFPDEKVRIIR